jgi:hypothetical protein
MGRTKTVTSTAPVLIPGQRMGPPPELSPAQAATWVEVIGSLPAGWIGRENAALLTAWCRHCDYADGLAADIAEVRAELAEAARPSDNCPKVITDPKAVRAARGRLYALLRAHKVQTDSLSRLAARLRLAQSSRYTRSAESAAIHARGNGTRPWENWS